MLKERTLMRLTKLASLGSATFLLCAAAVGMAQVDIPGFEEFGIDPNVSYSGTRHVETDEGSFEIKEYRAPQMFRADMLLDDDAGTMIMREDRQIGYLLMPSLNAYMEIPSEQVLEATHQARVLERRQVGRETVLGHQTTKYHAVFLDPDGVRHTGHMWVTDHGIPIRMDMVSDEDGEDAEHVLMELRDLVVGPQDPALFEVPAGYQPFNVGSLGDLMRGGDANAPRTTRETSPADDAAGGDSSVAEAAAEAAREEARRATREEAQRATREGLRSIFGR
jgi:hypothetical protein